MSLERTRYAAAGIPARLLLIPAALLLLWMLAPAAATAQMKNDHVSWTLLTPEIKGKPGDKVEVKIQAKIVPKAHLYTTKTYPDSVLGPSPTVVTAGENNVITRAGGVRGSKAPKKVLDPNFDLETEYWEGTVTLTIPVRIAKKAKPGEQKGSIGINFMTCNDKICRPPTDEKFTFTVTVEEDSTAADSLDAVAGANTADADTVPTTADTGIAAAGAEDTTDKAVAEGADGGPATIQDQINEKKEEGLLAYILFAMSFGFGALLTPCVFPMIPITVSFFTKREQKSRGHAVKDASIYGLGIILTFTALGAIVAAIYGAAGVSMIATNPIVNLFIAGIFIAFALSLFGLFEIQVPSSILNKLNAKANEGGGVTGILLMGFVFSLTSFTCTVPFVGPALASVGEGGDWFWPIIGMASFATAFSLPFFLLALFPSWMKALPKSGGWLNSVKVVMGFVEIAAAMKFLSNADLIWNWGALTREIVLAVWISIAILASLYLLGRYRLPHDTPIEKIGVARMLFSMGFLAVGFWFLTGLFGGRLGEVDAFLPPQEYPGKGNTSILAAFEGGAVQTGAASEATAEGISVDSATGVKWVAADGLSWIQDDYEMALAEAKRTGKPLFVDFTGYTCTNCRWMERNVFTREDVRDLMNDYVLVRLYTDRREESNKRNREMQIDRFNTIDLPFYALFSPEDKVLGQSVFTRDTDEFKAFLQRGLQGSQVVQKKPAQQSGDEMAAR